VTKAADRVGVYLAMGLCCGSRTVGLILRPCLASEYGFRNRSFRASVAPSVIGCLSLPVRPLVNQWMK